MILFLAQYPYAGQEQEGMNQRIIAMDDHFADRSRSYLFISHRQYWRRKKREIKPGVQHYYCNTFLHFFFILSLLRRADQYYVHSVVHVLAFLLYLPFFSRKKRLIWDVHGVAPEEQTLAGNATRAKQYALCERVLMKRAQVAICVTDRMVVHYKQKYPWAHITYQVYGILPAHLLQDAYELAPVQPSDIVNVIYSGNTQRWQHITLMLQCIREHRAPHIHYTILTGDLQGMRQQLKEAGLEHEPTITLAKVAAHELKSYYSRAHYGFILRDDIAVNQVACPTKMVEYLYYGMVPIVKSADIGDFKALGYEYISYRDFSKQVNPVKSRVNHELAKQLLQKKMKCLSII